MTINNRIRNVICDHMKCPPETVTSETTFEALGADSLDKIELVMAVEEEFNLEIHDDISAPWVAVGDVEKYIATQIN